MPLERSDIVNRTPLHSVEFAHEIFYQLILKIQNMIGSHGTSSQSKEEFDIYRQTVSDSSDREIQQPQTDRDSPDREIKKPQTIRDSPDRELQQPQTIRDSSDREIKNPQTDREIQKPQTVSDSSEIPQKVSGSSNVKSERPRPLGSVDIFFGKRLPTFASTTRKPSK
jgi:hypothetical protein